MDKNVRRIGRRVLAVIKDNDAEVVAKANEAGTTCKKGCNHCCKRVILITLPEGIGIAEQIMKNQPTQIPSYMRKFYKEIKAFEKETVEERRDCVFLNRNGSCDIYDFRPVLCRYTYVTSDPDHCNPLSGKDQNLLNFHEYEKAVWSEGNRIAKQVNIPTQVAVRGKVVPIVAPLPIAVVWGMRLLEFGPKGLNEVMELGDVMRPMYWIERLVPDEETTG